MSNSWENAIADVVAKMANHLLSVEMVKLTQQVAQHVQDEQRLQKAHFSLILDLQPERSQLERQDKQREQQDDQNLPLIFLGQTWPTRLKEWKQLHWPAEVSFKNQCGEQATFECLQWLNSLQWPTDSTGAINEAGITWAELFLDFLVDRRHSVPIRGYRDTATRFRWR